jgi:hypothetical protein
MPPKQQRQWPFQVEQSDESQDQLEADSQFDETQLPFPVEQSDETQDQMEPDSQFDETQRLLQQETADWKAGQTRKMWKNDRHEARCEEKRMKSEEDKNPNIIC